MNTMEEKFYEMEENEMMEDTMAYELRQPGGTSICIGTYEECQEVLEDNTQLSMGGYYIYPVQDREENGVTLYYGMEY